MVHVLFPPPPAVKKFPERTYFFSLKQSCRRTQQPSPTITGNQHHWICQGPTSQERKDHRWPYYHCMTSPSPYTVFIFFILELFQIQRGFSFPFLRAKDLCTSLLIIITHSFFNLLYVGGKYPRGQGGIIPVTIRPNAPMTVCHNGILPNKITHLTFVKQR